MKKLIYFVVFAFFIACNNDDIDLSGIVVDKEIEVKEFTSINISGKIEARLLKDNYGVVVNADNSIFEHLECFVSNNILNIYCNPNIEIPQSAAITVYISSPSSNLKSVNISNGGKFFADTTMLGNLSVSLSNSIAFLSGMDIRATNISLNNKSVLNISGISETADINVSNSSILNAGSLLTKESTVRVTGGSFVEANASDSIYAEVSKYSILKYKGEKLVFTKDNESQIIKED